LRIRIDVKPDAIAHMNIRTSARLVAATVPLVFLALLAGCGLTQGKKDAETVVARHFQMIATNGFDAAMADYSPVFFTHTTKAEWTKALTNINRKLGTYQNYTVSGWRVYENASTTGSGTTVLLQCEVVYAKFPATENFTLFKGLADSGYKIVGHHIESQGLLTE
jgi:hypothetical protein